MALTDVAQANKSSPEEEIPILMSEVLKDLAPQITEANAEIKLEPAAAKVRFSQKYHSPHRKLCVHISMQEKQYVFINNSFCRSHQRSLQSLVSGL